MQPINTRITPKGIREHFLALLGDDGHQVVRIVFEGLSAGRSVDVTTPAGAFRARYEGVRLALYAIQ